MKQPRTAVAETPEQSKSPLAELEDDDLNALLAERGKASAEKYLALQHTMLQFHLWYMADEPMALRLSLDDALDNFERAADSKRKVEQNIHRRVKQIARERRKGT